MHDMRPLELTRVLLKRGAGTHEGALLIICLHFPFSGNLHSTLHCNVESFKVTADIISILIHNNTLQNFVWSSIELNIHVLHFKNWLFFVWFLYKSDSCISCFRNDGEMKVSSDIPLYKWRVTWNYACIPFKYNNIV